MNHIKMIVLQKNELIKKNDTVIDPYSPFSTFHSTFSTLHSPLSTLPSPLFTLHSPLSTPYSPLPSSHSRILYICNFFQFTTCLTIKKISGIILSTVHSPRSTILSNCPLPTAHCLMANAHCPLPTAHCLLPTANSPLPTAHCPL